MSASAPRRPKPGNTVVNWLACLAIRVVICVIQAMPLELCYSIARLIGQLGWLLNKRHTAIALDNLRHAFGSTYTEEQYRAIVRRVYVHFAMLIMEIAHIP